MKKNWLLLVLVSSLFFLFSQLGYAQYNHDYSLVPVDLEIGPGDSTVEVDVHLYTGNRIKSFFVPLFAEGTSNPVLDTILTGGIQDTNPSAFALPSLVTILGTKVVNPYGPPSDPLYFLAEDSVGYAGPAWGLYCKMFYKVSGPGTLTFRTAVHSTLGAVHMIRYEDGDTLPLSWPAEGEVGSFNVVPYTNKYFLQPVDLRIAPDDSTVQFNININTRDSIQLFQVPLYAEGTSNPILDTILTGGLGDPNPPAFAPPSLVSDFATRHVNQYGPPSDPLLFMTKDSVAPLPPDTGLFCRMFYKVSGPGTLTLRTAVHSTAGEVSMIKPDAAPAPINWPSEGMIDSFNFEINEYSLEPVDLQISPCDSIVEVDIHIKLVKELGQINAFVVPLYAEGTSYPVLDTMLTGTPSNPLAFNPPSLVSWCSVRVVNPYGPPIDPLLFIVVCFAGGGPRPPQSGLYCRMFYKVSGPGTLTFRTAIHSSGGPVGMWGALGPVSINWPAEGEVGSFEVTQVNAYSLAPVNPKVLPGGGIVQVDLNIGTIDSIKAFMVPLFAEGTSNPVLDTVLTGGLGDADPPGFAPPSLVSAFSTKYINPYGPSTDPLIFMAHNFAIPLPPSSGLYCRMFYKVSGPGTLTFRTAVHTTAGTVGMWRPDATEAPINWPVAGLVGSFEFFEYRGDVNDDNRLNVSDVVYLINYLFRDGPAPIPWDSGDVDCSGGHVSVSDVIYLINYLFKGGPPPPC